MMRLSQKYGTVKIFHRAADRIELAVRRAVEMPLINSRRTFRQAAIDTFINILINNNLACGTEFDRAADRRLTLTASVSFSTGSPERELVEHEIVTQCDKSRWLHIFETVSFVFIIRWSQEKDKILRNPQ